ncbi:MAG: hypothetical protein COB08_018475 [Rhodobacteraceae bacterium]|nr:hypothetical protein [Paracoccaceae bacterium]
MSENSGFKEVFSEYRVVVGFHEDSGVRISEVWFDAEGREHHPAGEPAIRQWDFQGRLECEQYFRHGLEHRDGDHPAEIWYGSPKFPTQPTSKRWYKEGVQYRAADLPSEMTIDPDTGISLFEITTDANGNYVKDLYRNPVSGEVIKDGHPKPRSSQAAFRHSK